MTHPRTHTAPPPTRPMPPTPPTTRATPATATTTTPTTETQGTGTALGEPVLRFTVEGVDTPALSVVPALRFAVRVESEGGRPVEAIALYAQIRVVTATGVATRNGGRRAGLPGGDTAAAAHGSAREGAAATPIRGGGEACGSVTPTSPSADGRTPASSGALWAGPAQGPGGGPAQGQGPGAAREERAPGAGPGGAAGLGSRLRGLGIGGVVPRSMLWTYASAQVGPFTGATTVWLTVPCTYEFEAAVVRHFSLMSGGADDFGRGDSRSAGRGHGGGFGDIGGATDMGGVEDIGGVEAGGISRTGGADGIDGTGGIGGTERIEGTSGIGREGLGRVGGVGDAGCVGGVGGPGGEVPLEFVFSGRVFYADGDRLRAGAIPWGSEAAFGLPVRAWHEVMNHHFPDSAWLRIDDARFDRLCAYKAARSLATWDDVIDELLPGGG